MRKYIYNKEIHTVSGLQDAVRLADFALPEGIDPFNHFIVRLWQWDEADKEYSIEVFDPPGHQVFNEYDDALKCYNTLSMHYPEESTEESRLELMQYHLGQVRILQSRILFPPVLADEA